MKVYLIIMKKTTVFILFLSFFIISQSSIAQVDVVYTDLVWSDEFDSNGAVNSTKWFHQTQLPAGGSWFNGEVQHYTNNISNSFAQNGVLNIVDQCPNTTPGSLVDSAGCFTLPANNFTIETLSETCPEKNNGQIKITAQAALNYTTTINNVALNFTSSTSTMANLAPGTYNFCIGVTGQTYQQCYVVTVAAGTTVSGKSSVTSGKASVEIEKGTAPFTVFVNGQEQFETSAPIFSVDVKSGDILEVKTAVSCEGIYSKTIDAIDGVFAYPNPTQGTFEITVPTLQTEVVIELYSILSQLISVKTYPVVYGKVQLSLENKPTGLYFAKVNLAEPVTLKIIKQ